MNVIARLQAFKPIEAMRSEAALEDKAGTLPRSLNAFALTCFGVGSTIGSGIFVLTGTVAAEHAGPGVVLSFILAGVVCLLAGLCYAELASMVPVAGSAYSYAYATLGEGAAWLVGWCLVLEYLFSGSMVAIGWSSYAGSALQQLGIHLPAGLTRPVFGWQWAGGLTSSRFSVDFPAVAVTLFCTGILMCGARASANINSTIVCLKIAAIVVISIAGLYHAKPTNWVPLVPPNTGAFGQYGWSGVLEGAAILFFAFVGFDAVSTMAQDVREPQRTIPLSLMATLAICAALYVMVSLTLTGLVDYRMLNVPDPVYVALEQAGPALEWTKPVIWIITVLGLVSVLIVTLLGQTRIFYAMGRDGLISGLFARVDPRSGVPRVSVLVTGATCAVVAGMLSFQTLGELISMGTLLAFAVVCLGVLVLRVTRPDSHRPFRVPLAPWTPIGGFLACLYLMWSLPAGTWIRLLLWLIIGSVIYLCYGARNSKLSRASRSQPV